MKNCNIFKSIFYGGIFSAILGLSTAAFALTPVEELGKNIFFDTNLSEPAGQACASCHLPATGFAEPDQENPVSEGVIPGRFGGRNAPSAAYAVFFPDFSHKGRSNISGGQFWDGRAKDLTEQAKGPFLNPVEMNNPDKAHVIADIELSTYAAEFEQECGPDAFLPANVDSSYDCMAAAIAAYKETSEVSPFTSKFDAVQAGTATFTAQEEEGFNLFTGPAKCSNCHLAKAQNNEPAPIFTDFEYHNIGLPHNPEIDVLIGSVQPPDLGLGQFIVDPKNNGKFKNTHLRNVELTAPYMHNGVLKTLKEVVHFYNTRDIPGMWPAPEVPENLDSQFLGNLGLTDAEEDAIVAFMLTLTDGYSTP